MKKCDYCGYENEDNAVACADCRTSEFGPQHATATGDNAQPPSTAPLKCADCGIESLFAKGFHGHNADSNPRRYCPRCWAKKESRRHTRTLYAQLSFLVLGVLLVATGTIPSQGWVILNLLLLQAFIALVTLLHELGHAVIGRL